MEKLLEVRDLHIHFARRNEMVKAVNGISYDLHKGEILGMVGESGSGKSVGVKALMGILAKTGQVKAGSAHMGGRNLLALHPKELRRIRGRDVSMIFQDPMSSFNPTLRIGKQLMEPMLWHKLCGKKEARERAVALLEKVGIPAPEQRFKQYPFEFSGGMRQRAMIAMAIACNPQLLIADEPTTALDVTVQAQILELICSMRDELGMSVILITHDFGVAAQYCDRIAVMYAGKIVETAPIGRFLAGPRHPYSKALLKSMPVLGARKSPEPITGSPPNMQEEIAGCAYAPRCALASGKCASPPQLERIGDTDHEAACWHLNDGEEERHAASGA